MITVPSGVVAGIEGFLIAVEVDVRPGLPGFEIVGLPSATVRESRERVRSALRNSGYKFPSQKVIVNLAPAHYKKDGSLFDLPIALGILAHEGQIKAQAFEQHICVGELSLSGEIRPIQGVLSLAQLAQDNGLGLILPFPNHQELAIMQETRALFAPDLQQLVQHFNGIKSLPATPRLERTEEKNISKNVLVKGQEQAKRALEIAAHGKHHIMLLGPPGVGKTLLAKKAKKLLPPLNDDEIVILSKIYEAAGLLGDPFEPISERPLRSPHHSISQSALIGGRQGRPGEITLSHLGILLLDEFPEFNQGALQSLREPLDQKEIQISRVDHILTYPANFWLIATANPCPCGYYGSQVRLCTCSTRDLNRYRRKLCGPLIDRFDLFCNLTPLSEKELREKPNPWPRAKGRFSYVDLEAQITPSKEAIEFLLLAQHNLSLSVRGFEACLRLAKTIASLANKNIVSPEHVGEALHYRFESHMDLLY